MRASIWTSTCAAVVFGVGAGVLAQQPPPSTSPAQSSSTHAITVSGCIQRAAQSPTGTSGTAGAARDATESRFLLTSAAASATAPTGTSGSKSEMVAPSYRLDADDAKLTPHVGHKVEITGTVDQPSSSSASSMTSAPKLKVDTVKMVASTCS